MSAESLNDFCDAIDKLNEAWPEGTVDAVEGTRERVQVDRLALAELLSARQRADDPRKLHDVEKVASDESTYADRLRVHGGWLYRTFYDNEDGAAAVATTFVRDSKGGAHG